MKKMSTPVLAAIGFLVIVLISLNQFNRLPGTSYRIVSELVLYDQATKRTYEFENQDVRLAFIRQLSSQSSRGFRASDIRSFLEDSYHQTTTSENLIESVYGGDEGAIMKLGQSKLDLGTEIVSYPVFAGQYGNIRLETSLLCQEYQVEQRLANQTEWVYLGKYTVKIPERERYVPVYW